jgi:MerR family transcriptional regulator, light-induced transcriptional regulator
MDAFTIKDLENLSGIKAHTIRIWEQRYHFLKPKRTDTNIRYYSNEELKIILNIALLNKYGFKISHIDKMKPDEIQERILSLNDVQANRERIVNELLQQMVDLNIADFEKTLGGYIKSKGMERTVYQIIFPFLEKIGVLWQTGHINPAQEHLVSNIIRQKLIGAIETCIPALKQNSTALLFLPEGEHHELGILFLHYILKNRGVKTIYMGANVPVKDASYIIRLKQPDYVFLHLTATAPVFHLDRFLSAIHQGSPTTPFIISGLLSQQYKKAVPQNIQLKKSMEEVLEFISGIK